MRDVERYQAVLGSLLSEEENKYCADCQAKGTGHRRLRCAGPCGAAGPRGSGRPDGWRG